MIARIGLCEVSQEKVIAGFFGCCFSNTQNGQINIIKRILLSSILEDWQLIQQHSSATEGKPRRKGISRIIWASYYSWCGFRSAIKYEAAFRQEIFLVGCMLPFAFLLGDSVIEYLVLIGSGVLVLIVELLNSAIEAVVDRIGSERHTLSGQAKDMGSAAVFLSLLLMAICWGSLSLKYFLK